MDTQYIPVPVRWGLREQGTEISANPIDTLMPIIKEWQAQLNEGIATYSVEKALPRLKKALFEPADASLWVPGMSLEQARWAARKLKPNMSYEDLENYMMEHYAQSIDICSSNEVLIGNYCDVALYFVNREEKEVYRIPMK